MIALFGSSHLGGRSGGFFGGGVARVAVSVPALHRLGCARVETRLPLGREGLRLADFPCANVQADRDGGRKKRKDSHAAAKTVDREPGEKDRRHENSAHEPLVSHRPMLRRARGDRYTVLHESAQGIGEWHPWTPIRE